MPIDLSNAHPADVVVPLSDMLDLLSSRLDEQELDSLSEELIRRRSTQVSAGDVISAELMNQILADIDNLQTRITVLEEGIPDVDKPQIILVSPSNGVVIGQALEVSGFNLSPSQLTSVRIGNRTVPIFGSASHDRLLVFDVPAILGIPTEGADVNLEINNQFGSDQVTVRVLQAQHQELSTAISLAYVDIPQDTLDANTEYTIRVRVSALTSLAANYRLSVHVDNDNWRVRLSDGQHQITIPRSQPNPYVIEIDAIVTTGSTGRANFVMRIEAIGQPDQNGVSENLLLNIGTVTEVNTEITFQAPEISPNNIDPQTGNILLRAESTINFAVTSILSLEGTYDITQPHITNNPNDRWTASLLSSEIAIADQVNEIHQNFISLNLSALASSNDPIAHIHFTVARRGSSEPPAEFTRSLQVIE